jgi:hypothetical protein
MTATLLFVYNAPEGVFAAIGDAIHKTLSPATYPCSLCAISYGAVRMRPAWQAHLRALPYATRFFHRPDFHRALPALVDVELPAILIDDGTGPRVIVDATTLNRVGDVDELIDVLDRALGQPTSSVARS